MKNHADFSFPSPIKLTKTIHNCLDSTKQDDSFYYTPKSKYYKWLEKEVIKQDSIYQLRRIYIRENKSRLCPTLTANMGIMCQLLKIVMVSANSHQGNALTFKAIPKTLSYQL